MKATDDGSGPRLGSLVRRGLAWSTATNVVLRFASTAVGIVLARLLTPEQFGVYAIALTVQAVLMTIADLGLSADLVRSEDPERRAPTVGALGLMTGTALCVSMASAAPWLAATLGSDQAAGAIAILSLTLLLAGAGVVPFATLLRRFDQRGLFVIGLADFAVSTVITLGGVLAGFGVLSLALGRVCAQAATLALQFRFAGDRPRYALDRQTASSVLAFGLPVAGANLLSWALLGVDKVVVGKVGGAQTLGYYVLAFNVSAWPMSLAASAVRSVAIPGFSRMTGTRGDAALARVTGPTWAFAVGMAGVAAGIASPLIGVVYGEKWQQAAVMLAPLALFGAFRVLFDLLASFLFARGASLSVMLVQLAWIVVLVPALLLGASAFGMVGAAYAQLATAVLVAFPAYVLALRAVNVEIPAFLRVMVIPTVVGAMAGVVARLATELASTALLALSLGAAAGVVTVAVLNFRMLYPAVRTMRGRRSAGIAGDVPADVQISN